MFAEEVMGRQTVKSGEKAVYECARCNAMNELDISPKPTVLRCINCGYPIFRRPCPGIARVVYTSKLSEEARLFVEEESISERRASA